MTGRRFPLLPEGAGARELGSLIAFAGDGLPEAGWRLLTLCLSAEAPAASATAAQGLELLRRLGGGSISPQAMGQLVQSLAGLPSPTPTAGTLIETVVAPGPPRPQDFAQDLQRRLRGAFCAHRVVVQKDAAAPSYTIEIDPGPGRAYDALALTLLQNLLHQTSAVLLTPQYPS
jgi:hypothetical protein